MHIYILHVCNYSQFSISKIAEHTPERDPLHFGDKEYICTFNTIHNKLYFYNILFSQRFIREFVLRLIQFYRVSHITCTLVYMMYNSFS